MTFLRSHAADLAFGVAGVCLGIGVYRLMPAAFWFYLGGVAAAIGVILTRVEAR